MNNKDKWMRDAGVEASIDSCVENLREEFELSDNQIAKALREKAREIAPSKPKTKTIIVDDKMLKKILEHELGEQDGFK